ncbi:hypothetical protein EIP91_010861 [Steccherinum ochraceum]|uniref:F-box domain-containing protein n=1 Tax=Steccherinum ochraceum TaxID=92696 RepID=A0A4R0R055_9APHY|nr:hypothetical protein EIP91_010861 [Steccherinum ochraceum]
MALGEMFARTKTASSLQQIVVKCGSQDQINAFGRLVRACGSGLRRIAISVDEYEFSSGDFERDWLQLGLGSLSSLTTLSLHATIEVLAIHDLFYFKLFLDILAASPLPTLQHLTMLTHIYCPDEHWDTFLEYVVSPEQGMDWAKLRALLKRCEALQRVDFTMRKMYDFHDQHLDEVREIVLRELGEWEESGILKVQIDRDENLAVAMPTTPLHE